MLRRMNFWANIKTETNIFFVLENNSLKPQCISGKWLSKVMKHKAQLKKPDSTSSFHILCHSPCVEKHIGMLKTARVWGFWKAIFFLSLFIFFSFSLGSEGAFGQDNSHREPPVRFHVQLVLCKLHPCELSPSMKEFNWRLSSVWAPSTIFT